MKEDAPVPTTVPAKRRQLEAALDRWLAVWLERDDLTPSQRRRVEEERERRKRQRVSAFVTLGVLVGREGMTPAQRAALDDYRERVHATSVVEPRSDFGIRTLQAVVKSATFVFAAPKEPREPAGPKTGVWAGVKYARHRNVPVRVVLSDGKEL